MYRVALFGLPTAGKSSLSYLAAERLGIAQINVGQLLRERRNGFIEIAMPPEPTVGVSDKLVNSLVDSELERACNRGFIIDGFPRNTRQLEFLDALPHSKGCWFLFLDIGIAAARNRYLRRRNCSNCRRAQYLNNITSNLTCLQCGSSLIWRADTTLHGFETKLQEFRAKEEPLIKHLVDVGRLWKLTVSGDLMHDLGRMLQLLSTINQKDEGESLAFC